MKSRKPKVIDLFAGCGGMSWGLHKTGFDVIAAIELLKVPLETFKANHPKAKIFDKDITKLPAGKVMLDLGLSQGELDCLIGGPPCQGFSKNVPAKSRFLEDARNLLFRNYLDYVKVFKPKVVVMENVAEIYNAYDGAVRNEIQDTLVKMGYQVISKVLYGPDYGLPQRRRRCFFFASRTGHEPKFPEPTHAKESNIFIGKYNSAWDAISDLPKVKNGMGSDSMDYDSSPKNDYQKIMRQGSSLLSDHITRALKEKQLLRVKALKPGQAWKDLPIELRPNAGYSGAYGRLDYEMLAPTITRWVFHPGSGRYSHPRENRLLTIREVARLQSFTDDFVFKGTYIEKAHQLGNAVPPIFMMVLSDAIKACLSGETAKLQRHLLPKAELV